MLGFDTVSCDLDPGAAGKQAGWLDLTHSDNINAYGIIRSPIGRIGAGGDVPTALVVGGNHGDEYEGQIITRRLFAELEAADVPGRLLLLPALNMPAVLDRNRVSPLDGGNMNRAFPGGAGQGPTRALAGFVTRHLLPRANLVIDLHSGGKTAEYLDAAYLTLTGHPQTDRRSAGLAATFGLPWTMVARAGSSAGDLDTAALAQGCAMISCELGGQGTVSRRSLDRGWQGVLRLLAAEGVMTAQAAARLGLSAAAATRYLDLEDGARHLTAMQQAIAEPLADLGQQVAAGQPLSSLHPLFELGSPDARILTAPVPGVIAIRRTNGLVAAGDHLMTIAPEITAEALGQQIA